MNKKGNKSKRSRTTFSARRGEYRSIRKTATARATRAGLSHGTRVIVPVPKKGSTKPLPSSKVTGGEAGRSKYQSKVEGLIRLGRERGYVTYDEILREFPTIEDNVVLLEEMYERFSSAGIDVLESGGMLEDTASDGILERKKLQNRRSDLPFKVIILNALQSRFDISDRIFYKLLQDWT